MRYTVNVIATMKLNFVFNVYFSNSVIILDLLGATWTDS